MNQLDRTQIEIARLLFELPEASGYALAGGAALIATGTIDRPTRDIDIFTQAQPAQPPGDVTLLSRALTTELETNGWSVETIRLHQTFARLIATRDSESVEIDLAVDSPRLFPTTAIDGIPVFDPRDLAARKILAILDRAEGRDFTDLEALQHRHGQAAIIDWAQKLDTGITNAAISTAFNQIQRLDDTELPTDDPRRTRQLFATWSTELNP
jgi:hypothetical protein